MYGRRRRWRFDILGRAQSNGFFACCVVGGEIALVFDAGDATSLARLWMDDFVDGDGLAEGSGRQKGLPVTGGRKSMARVVGCDQMSCGFRGGG